MVSSAMAKSLGAVYWPSLMYSPVDPVHSHEVRLPICVTPDVAFWIHTVHPLVSETLHMSTQFVSGET